MSDALFLLVRPPSTTTIMSKVNFKVSSSPESSPTLDTFSRTNSMAANGTNEDESDSQHRPKVVKHMSLDTEYKGPVVPPSSKKRKKEQGRTLGESG